MDSNTALGTMDSAFFTDLNTAVFSTTNPPISMDSDSAPSTTDPADPMDLIAAVLINSQSPSHSPMPQDESYTQNELLNILQGSDSDITSDNDSSSDESDDDLEASTRTQEDWSKTERRHRVSDFREIHGLKQRMAHTTPVSFFNLIFTIDFFQYLVDNINRYAKKMLNNNNFTSSRITRWTDITIREFKIFLGLLFNMGILSTYKIDNYWKKDELFNVPVFPKHMSRDKFLLILRCLNFESHEANCNDRMSKISTLINKFNTKMEEIFYPDKILCIDESLVLFRGRLWIRQYLKGKKNKYGIKLYLLTDQFGLVQKVIVYGGKTDKELGGKDHVNKVVKKLMSGKLDVGHSLYMDNYYNSIQLTKYLVTRNTHVTGTLRANRRNNPSAVVHKKLKKGEKITRYNSDGICVTKWKDRRELLMLSTEHSGNREDHVNRRNEHVTKPKCVLEYNKYMGGVDRHDQMMSYYNCEHKTLRWYKKLGIHIIQMMLVNSHNLYNRFGEKPIPLVDYRTIVIRHLLAQDNALSGAIITTHSVYRLPRGNNNKYKRKRCVVCYKQKKTVFVSTCCAKCPRSPGLCIGKCFDDFHK